MLIGAGAAELVWWLDYSLDNQETIFRFLAEVRF